MPAGKHKSRTMRRVFIKPPGKKTKIHYRQRKPSKIKCHDCGKDLHGIPHLITSKFKNLSKSKKRPQRPFGGNLCSSCMRKKILDSIMNKEKK